LIIEHIFWSKNINGFHPMNPEEATNFSFYLRDPGI